MPILHWLSRNHDIEAVSQVDYCVLEEAPELHYGDLKDNNLLIQGDNLDALKALLPYYAGQVKCIYIDPPYNTGHAFEQYDDNVEHALWLAIMYPRLELLRQFLSEDGSIWISIDDDEQAYLKVLCDEVFGRKNFINNVVWEKKYSPQNDAKWLSDSHDFIMAYAKNKNCWRPNLLERTTEMNARYKNRDNDLRGPWKAENFSARTYSPSGDYPITLPSGRVVRPPESRAWITSENSFHELVADNRIWFGARGDSVPSQKKFLSEVKQGATCKTIWKRDEVGDNEAAKKESKALFAVDSFSTPKPEKLIERILYLSSAPGDLVMDSFLGSGTTAAVAHKMGRRYIGIEMGEHCVTHCQPRLVKVIEGEQGGISKAQNWQGGGGFRFCRLGAPLFNEQGLISHDVSFRNLSAHIWFSETYTPIANQGEACSALLGVHDDVAYVVLHPEACKSEVLTTPLYKKLRGEIDALGIQGVNKIVIYGESCRMGESKMREAGVVFKQIPYDVKAS